jgi:hypothetical protein
MRHISSYKICLFSAASFIMLALVCCLLVLHRSAGECTSQQRGRNCSDVSKCAGWSSKTLAKPLLHQHLVPEHCIYTSLHIFVHTALRRYTNKCNILTPGARHASDLSSLLTCLHARIKLLWSCRTGAYLHCCCAPQSTKVLLASCCVGIGTLAACPLTQILEV